MKTGTISCLLTILSPVLDRVPNVCYLINKWLKPTGIECFKFLSLVIFQKPTLLLKHSHFWQWHTDTGSFISPTSRQSCFVGSFFLFLSVISSPFPLPPSYSRSFSPPPNWSHGLQAHVLYIPYVFLKKQLSHLFMKKLCWLPLCLKNEIQTLKSLTLLFLLNLQSYFLLLSYTNSFILSK